MYLCSLPFICPYHSRTKSIYKYRPPTIQYTYKYIYIHLYMYDHDGHILYEDDDVVTMLWLSNTTNVRRRHDECLYVLRKCIYVYAIRWCHSLEWRWKWNHIRRRMDWRGSGAGGCLCGGICTNISRAVSGHSHNHTLTHIHTAHPNPFNFICTPSWCSLLTLSPADTVWLWCSPRWTRVVWAEVLTNQYQSVIIVGAFCYCYRDATLTYGICLGSK